jgi:hypothetical protein
MFTMPPKVTCCTEQAEPYAILEDGSRMYQCHTCERHWKVKVEAA